MKTCTVTCIIVQLGVNCAINMFFSIYHCIVHLLLFVDLTRHWQFIGQFCEAFEPAFVLTLKLQKNHCPLSEFYISWLQCQAQLDKLKSNKLAKRLLEAFKVRAKKLVSTLQFKACLYFDPRFNFLGSKRLSTDDKEKVQVSLPLYAKKQHPLIT